MYFFINVFIFENKDIKKDREDFLVLKICRQYH